ncbi:hypothetical protein [Nostoc sp. FACHB-110]|uniref:hypothetical protein n=1 Tax=Nostoc sp. FACHB-110 TaxID=2692834 RepID=UPI001685F1BF|nr:hypothetical protein [Nostoc sp. FACHB-110]MBD2440555.1 hypothetical protein [Nostoc sp. FACHB-110]
MIEAGDANTVKNDYLETLETLINRIKIKANEKEIDAGNQISIYAGTKKVYQGVKGEKPTLDKLNPEVVDQIQKAVNEPHNLKGSITIKIGKQEVFKVSNGQVVNDKLGLSGAVVQKPASKERTYTLAELQKQVDVLKNKVSQQEKTITELSGQQNKQTLDKLTQEIASLADSVAKQQKLIEAAQKSLNGMSLVKPQNTMLQNWIGSIETKVKETGNSLLDGAKNKLQEVGLKINAHVRSVKGKMIESAVSVLLNKLGERQKDGSLSFKSNKFEFHQEGNNITVKTKDGRSVLQNGEIAPQLPPAVREDADQLPEKVFQYIDKVEQHKQETLQSKQATPSLSR